MTDELTSLLEFEPSKWQTNEYREYRRVYRKRDRLLHPEKNLEWGRRHRERHRAAINAKARDFYHRNKIKCRENNRRYLRENVEAVRAYARNLRQTNPQFRLRSNLSRRVSRFLKNKSRYNTSTMKLLGCSLQEFRQYLESKFKRGMTWDNYGHNGWHVDHIIPCISFDLIKPEHQRRCFHFSNLQPLWAKDNLSKRAKILTNQFNLL